jgi:hypothetical protein
MILRIFLEKFSSIKLFIKLFIKILRKLIHLTEREISTHVKNYVRRLDVRQRFNCMSTGVVKELRTVARQGRKGHLYRPDPVPHGPTPEEQVRIIKRRVQKAERDERMDLTIAITPPKTFVVSTISLLDMLML